MENGKPVNPPARKAAAIAVISNPFAVTFEEELEPLTDIGDILGEELSRRALRALAISPDKVESFGKGALSAWGGSWNTRPPFCIPNWDTLYAGSSAAARR